MADGVLVGGIVMLLGLLIGGVGVWYIERWHDDERQRLFHHLGEMQRAMESSRIPEEEL